ncbi:L-fucono-1,5-lactonase-like [Clytia hemisphaerica]|uniref:Amidohydrolase-related domain-containing protein n=1 Tax=Clytia hemisphaerica TaxID=252671 RepID=A0A7M5VDI3_9CNID
MENIIDCHLHLWDVVNNEMVWPTPEDKLLYQNYLVPDFLESSKDVPHKKCILVQCRQKYEETDWYLKFAEENDFIVGVVGWVDLKDKDGTLRERLKAYKQNPYFSGVRHIVHDEPRDDWLLDENVLKGLATLEEEGVTYDLLIFQKHVPICEQVVKMFPKLNFVIDHMSKPSIDQNDLDSWSENMKELAAYPNVHCKISGLSIHADSSKPLAPQITPYIKRIIEIFGSARCLFGSDWPVCLLGITYSGWYELVKSSIQHLSNEDQDNIWFKTAQKVYHPNV